MTPFEYFKLGHFMAGLQFIEPQAIVAVGGEW